MREEYDFSDAKRASEMPHLVRLQAEAAKGITRITLYLDDDVLEALRERAEADGHGYQTLINDALRSAIRPECAPVTVDALRRILREELRAA